MLQRSRSANLLPLESLVRCGIAGVPHVNTVNTVFLERRMDRLHVVREEEGIHSFFAMVTHVWAFSRSSPHHRLGLSTFRESSSLPWSPLSGNQAPYLPYLCLNSPKRPLPAVKESASGLQVKLWTVVPSGKT